MSNQSIMIFSFYSALANITLDNGTEEKEQSAALEINSNDTFSRNGSGSRGSQSVPASPMRRKSAPIVPAHNIPVPPSSNMLKPLPSSLIQDIR